MQRFLLFLVTLIATLISTSSYAAPKANLWPYWQTFDESSTIQISHQPWQSLLDSYLIRRDEHTLFRYAAVSNEDKQRLKQYLAKLAEYDPRTLNRSEQYAYWVNLYNAVTVDLILDNYPIKSITKLGGLFSFGPWDEKVVTINGYDITLNDIEHRVLRPIWNDPRTHYAVNCASLGCPNLQPQAFTASNSEALLEQAAREFIASRKGVTLQGNKAQLSSIYDWFAEDFGGKARLFEHIGRYSSQYRDFSGKVNFEYDWRLNSAD
ncbi:DUF547 domain-containing protein [Vibrio sp. IRLE0018]|uniref:DUF547 domain-containing protein n=1 Tax=Vibrio floridensis TaxID=2908007 RepID=UPI001F43B3EE|nr:DUF547 domain-containing protein [Vibrio floridensis]MCF8780432.1 DUF547 domain-containing protein [Vibrio floridensis]